MNVFLCTKSFNASNLAHYKAKHKNIQSNDVYKHMTRQQTDSTTAKISTDCGKANKNFLSNWEIFESKFRNELKSAYLSPSTVKAYIEADPKAGNLPKNGHANFFRAC